MIIKIYKTDDNNFDYLQNFQGVFYEVIGGKVNQELLSSLDLKSFISARLEYKKISFLHNLELKKVFEEKNYILISIDYLNKNVESSFLTKHIVHNLGNLLTTINNNAYYLESVIDKFNSDIAIRDIVSNIKNTAENAGKITKEFLNFQYLKQSNDSFVLKDLILDCYAILDYSFKRYQILSLLEEKEQGICIAQNKYLLAQVLLALYINAIDAFSGKYKASESLNKRVIKTTLSVKESDVVIVIYDNGIGMSKDELLNVFKHQYTTKKNGTGLGLFMTKEIIESLQGEVSLKSKQDSFTEVRLQIKKSCSL